MIPYFEPAVG